MVNADLRRRHQQSSNDNDDALLQPCFGIASGAGRSRQAALLFLLIAGSSMVLPCVRAFTASTSQRSRLINRNKSLVRTPRFLPPVPLSYGAIDSLEKRPPVSSLISSSCCSTRLFSTTSSSTSIHTTITAKSTTTTTITKAVDLKHVDYCNHVVTPFAEGTSAGSTPKPPAIFLHGLLGNKRNFASIGKSLSQQIHHPRRIVGLDLRNHGDNHHDWRHEMSYAAMAADVLQFCDSQGFEEVELIGHSVGGKVAQAVALLEPQRVKGLVVIDIAPVQYTPDEPHWKAVQDIIDSLLTVQLQPGIAKRDVDQQLRTLIPDSALRAFCLTNLDLAAGEWKIPLSYIHSQLDGLAGFDIGSGEPQSSPQHPPKQFTGDAFFIHGGQSRFVRHQHLDVIGQLFPNHMLTTIRGAGHWVHAEAPEDTTALLQRFLDR